MRKRFEDQMKIGQRPIASTPIDPKSSFRLTELFAALKEIFCNDQYNDQLFRALEEVFTPANNSKGRSGMDLWTIFVFAQVRLCGNMSYEDLHDLANNHKTLRHLIGAQYEYGYESPSFSYQNIYDNVSALSNETLIKINAIVVEFGHKEVFKKKEGTALRLKSDSYVVESNVHFPTDYNLLWDCQRKVLDMVKKLLKLHPQLSGWRKIQDWYRNLKNLNRAFGKASSGGGKHKASREVQAAITLLEKSNMLVSKTDDLLANFALESSGELTLLIVLEHFNLLAKKHINLFERRMIKGQKIPHHEKMFSVFETYTEWVKKGKSRPSVELGKKVCITTDEHHLILDYRIMHEQQDKDITLDIAQDLLEQFPVRSWSFDKGYWDKQVKEILKTEVELVIMPKKGKLNQQEKMEESTKEFKKFRNKHSAIESNINELEQRGADRCPDRGWKNFEKYISLAVCSYNLKKLGRQILEVKRKAEVSSQKKTAA